MFGRKNPQRPKPSNRALVEDPQELHSPDPQGGDALQGLFERVLDHLRGIKRWRRDAVIPVQIDLVGSAEPSPTPPAMAPGSTGHDAPSTEEAPLAAASPSVFSRAAETNETKPVFSPQAWSFTDAVVLRRTNRSSRLLLYVVLGFTGTSLLWLVVAPLNQTVLVQGKLEPNTRVKTLKAPVAGVVDEVLVKEGQRVKAGDVLLRFDVREAQSRLENSERIRDRLLAENQLYGVALGDAADPAVMAKLSAEQRRRLNSQTADLQSQRDAARSALNASEARLAGLRQSLATAENIAARFSSLVESGAVSVVQQLQAQATVDELKAKLSEEQRQIQKLEAELRRSNSAPDAELRTRIDANNREIHTLDQRIAEAQLQLQYGVITAPTAGRVFDLDVRAGSVTRTTEPLVKVVPNDALQARVYVPSSSIGFIQAGQQADISLDTFPAADYGRIEATVLRVSTDALTSEESKEVLGKESAGLSYPAVLQLDRQYLQAGKKQIPLQPGMSLSADIHLRQRRFIQVITGFFEDKLRSLERLR